MSDPGAGQQQGREMPEHNERHDAGLRTCVWQRAGQDCLMHGPAPSPAPPARVGGYPDPDGYVNDPADLESPAPSPAPPAQDGGRNESDQALDLLRAILGSEEGGQSLRIIAMLKDLPASIGRGGQVEHVRRFLRDEMDRAASPHGDAPGEAWVQHEWRCPSCGATTRARMADR